MGTNPDQDTIALRARLRLALVHAAVAALALALAGTGLLLGFPDLRADLVGGHALRISTLHRQLGVLLVVVPALLVLAAPAAARRELHIQFGLRATSPWRRVHVWGCMLVAAVLVLSGALLWIDPGLSVHTVDRTSALHLALTWVVIGYLPLHALEAALRRNRKLRRHR